jgi:hypothetical protein
LIRQRCKINIIIPSSAETLPGASKGFSLRQNVCISIINLLVILSLTIVKNPLLVPGNVSADEGIPLNSYLEGVESVDDTDAALVSY